MKALKIIFFTTVFLFHVKASSAQKGYINLNAEYGINFPYQNIGTDITSNSVTVVKGTFGKGINCGGNIGYQVKKNVAIELGANYITGSKYKLAATSAYYLPETINLKGKMLKLVPAVKLGIGQRGTGYVRIGLAVGVLNRLIINDDYTDNSYQRTLTTEVYKKGISFGVNTAIGVQKMTSKNFGFFAEINSTSQSWAPKQSEITQYDVAGVSQLGTLKTNEKQFEYVSTYDPNAVPISSEPTKQLKHYYSFSNIGFFFE